MVRNKSFLRQGGFTYLMLLLALTAVALSLLKSQDAIKMQRRQQQETELLFRGEQIREAMRLYRIDEHGNGCFPSGFEALIRDTRSGKTRYHLRQWFTDPLTGQKAWGMIFDDQHRWIGVYSKGLGKPLRKEGFVKDSEKFRDAKNYREWAFTLEKDPSAPLPSACR
ncbi:hypothetical protein [Pantoea sp. y20]